MVLNLRGWIESFAMTTMRRARCRSQELQYLDEFSTDVDKSYIKMTVCSRRTRWRWPICFITPWCRFVEGNVNSQHKPIHRLLALVTLDVELLYAPNLVGVSVKAIKRQGKSSRVQTSFPSLVIRSWVNDGFHSPIPSRESTTTLSDDPRTPLPRNKYSWCCPFGLSVALGQQ